MFCLFISKFLIRSILIFSPFLWNKYCPGWMYFARTSY